MINQKNTEFNTLDRNLLELLRIAETVARSKATVLLQGDSGAGKRTLAEYIVKHSQRAQRPLVIFNAQEVALGEQDLEFKKALTQSIGGTLLIIEASKLNFTSQARFFQALNDGFDIRFLVTTNRNLGALVKQGDFREDLFYRINVVNLKIPALRERLGDVELLAKASVKKWAAIHGKGELLIASDVIPLLNSHTWPGNVRELEMTIERAVLVTAGTELRARDIQFAQEAKSVSLEQAVAVAWKPGRTLDEIERNVILEALKFHEGNRTHTAKALGISIRTLRNKLAEYRVLGIQA